jgi:aerobic carbon-monoxide dehydrogenase large subunit
MGAAYFGASVRRREDPRLLRGEGCFVEDLNLAGQLQVAFLRSSHAHAAIRSVDPRAAQALPGVVAVFTFDNLRRWMRPMPTFGAPPAGLARAIDFSIRPTDQFPLAETRVRFVGEIVAMVVAESRGVAESGAELIAVEYEPLPALVNLVTASEPGASRLYPDWPDNAQLAFEHTIGDPAAALAAADVVVRERFDVQRYVGMPLEGRGVVAQYDRGRRALTVWNATQAPHFVQQNLAGVLGLAQHQVRVVAPDVGGGFGTKCNPYAEDVLVPLAAVELGRPVKWIEDRREHLAAAAHARDQVHFVELGARADGTILGIRDRILLDVGAYNPWGCVLPYNTVAHLIGPYQVRNLAVDVTAVVSNKSPNAPYRGAGRPEVVFAIERAVDCLARELGLDPAELRQRNFIRAEQLPYDLGMPYRDGNPLVYDSGDFPATLAGALGAIDYAGFRKEQASLRRQGILRGIGLAGYVEGTGIGPYEGASVRVDLDGRVVVASGSCSQGQGHETAYAQLAADELGVPLEWVTVIGGDTGAVPFGLGTYASRGAVTAGSSIVLAAREVRQKLLEAAAALNEVAPTDIEIAAGQVGVRGLPDSALPLGRLVQACLPAFATPGPAAPRFEAQSYHHIPTVTYTNAVHAALVEVDPETGLVSVLKYAVSHDCGRLINPRLVDGQIHGGVAQGLGGALLEELVYDSSGQLLTGSLIDYLVPTSLDVPEIDGVHLETASPRNPLGVKGVGEGGAIAPPAAIANAVEDALSPWGIRVTATPLHPDRIRALLRAAGAP